jgi:hypothetical protein
VKQAFALAKNCFAPKAQGRGLMKTYGTDQYLQSKFALSSAD